MPFSHNACYHRLLWRQIPAGAGEVLDVGCGIGTFARRAARAGMNVHAVDSDSTVIAFAQAAGSPGPSRIVYQCADITDVELPAARYDLITCIAALHHVPFDTVTRLAAALRPGEVLLILGVARDRSPIPLLMWGLLAPPLNLLARALVAAGEWCNGGPEPASPMRLVTRRCPFRRSSGPRRSCDPTLRFGHCCSGDTCSPTEPTPDNNRRPHPRNDLGVSARRLQPSVVGSQLSQFGSWRKPTR